MSQCNWREEHGNEYAVPDVVQKFVSAGRLVDLSWKNDTCPRFGSPHTRRVALWIEHPEQDRRDNGWRFAVCEIDEDGYEGEYAYAGDDLAEALAAFRLVEDANTATRRIKVFGRSYVYAWITVPKGDDAADYPEAQERAAARDAALHPATTWRHTGDDVAIEGTEPEDLALEVPRAR